jgi:hypothetical protein
MSDEPPPEYDYEVDWHGERESTSFFGCVGMAFGIVFILTGGMCAFLGFTGSSVGAGLIGLMFVAVGWKLMNR